MSLSGDDAELVVVGQPTDDVPESQAEPDDTAGEEGEEEELEEEDEARYFHMLQEEASGRLRLFIMPKEDYRWFTYCFQGYELPDGQSAQQILNMAAVHDEIPLAARASSAKRWIREFSTIEAVWQHNHDDADW